METWEGKRLYHSGHVLAGLMSQMQRVTIHVVVQLVMVLCLCGR